MKIMQINCVYKSGSTGKILYDLEKYFTDNGSHVINIYGHGIRPSKKTDYKVLNNFSQFINTIYTYLSGYMYKGSMSATVKIIRIIKKHKPDIINLHSINGHMVNIYVLLKWLKKNNIPLVITNHAEFLYTGSYTHVPDGSDQWLTGKKEKIKEAKKLTNSLFFDNTHKAILKMERAFNNYNNLTVVSVSPWVTNRSKKSFVFQEKNHLTILNGINTEIFFPRNSDSLKEKWAIKDEKIILHVTSGFNNKMKGSKYIIELVQMMEDSKYKFIFIGIDKSINLPKNCINAGIIKDQDELAQYYSLADVTVITSYKETFSMIVAESMACGTPVVGFKAGGPETITINEHSKFVDFGNMTELQAAVTEFANYTNINISKEAHQKYSKENMGKKYLELYQRMLKKQL